MVRSIRRNFRICSRCTVETFDLSVCLRVCMCACERERERERERDSEKRERKCVDRGERSFCMVECGGLISTILNL